MQTPAQKHLKKADKVLAKIIARINLKERKAHKRYFESLVVAIINQQLSGKAADTIQKRFVALFKGKNFPKPDLVLKKPNKVLRSAGLSFQKISYIKSLAKLVVKGQIDFNKFKKLSDEEIIIVLTKVKGIGRWTAEMFLMFCLGRPDVFSHGDLGLKNAVQKWYKLDMKKHPKKYHKLVQGWSPHRTITARYLWASLD
ncbi:MAG TPA: DNA-3-methyladenine glycosylase 2 family protein [Candidatus Limnocylindria bacterium]|nr:DNA-3-methyladenine glycosylase 2 family protein [Candidatus Limnocylindria bacterium]